MTNKLSYFYPHNLLFDSVFDEFIKHTSIAQRMPSGFPLVDQELDTDGSVVLEFALAGYKKKDLEVAVEGSKLTVSSDGRKLDLENDQSDSHKRIARRAFRSTFTDHKNDYDLRNLEATFEDGLLKIKIPKKEKSNLKLMTIK